MIRIGILGDIGSGKSYVARNFGYPVFNADMK
jgi:dephospho-CoA kinase